MERRVEVHTTITRELYREMAYFQVFRRKKTTLPLGILGYLVAIAVVVSKLLGYYTVDQFVFGQFTFYLCVALLFLPFLMVGLTEWQVKKVAEMKNTTIGQSHTLIIDDEGITTRVESGEAGFHWIKLREGHEIKKAFLFYVRETQALAIDKGQLTAEQADTIRALAIDHMGKRFTVHRW